MNTTTSSRSRKPRSGAEPPVAVPFTKIPKELLSSPIQSIAANRIAGVHPDVTTTLATDLLFLQNAFPAMTLAGVLHLLQSHCIGLSPANRQGIHYVVTGLRTWQAYEAARVRSIINLDALPARILTIADSPQTIADMALIDAYLGLELYALHPGFTPLQMEHLRQRISDEAWREVYGRAKPVPSTPDQKPSASRRRRPRSAQLAPSTTGGASKQSDDFPAVPALDPPPVAAGMTEARLLGPEAPAGATQDLDRTEPT